MLRAINFSAISFDVIVVEADGHNRTKDDAVTGLLADAGCDLYKHFRLNNWYTRHDFVPRASDRLQGQDGDESPCWIVRYKGTPKLLARTGCRKASPPVYTNPKANGTSGHNVTMSLRNTC